MMLKKLLMRRMTSRHSVVKFGINLRKPNLEPALLKPVLLKILMTQAHRLPDQSMMLSIELRISWITTAGDLKSQPVTANWGKMVLLVCQLFLRKLWRISSEYSMFS
jgi:hypothetical protein